MDDKKEQLEESIKKYILEVVKAHPGEYSNFDLAGAIMSQKGIPVIYARKLIAKVEGTKLIRQGISLDSNVGHLKPETRTYYLAR